MRDVEGDALHLKAPRDEAQQRRQQRQHQGGAEKLRHAENPHLGDRRFEDCEKCAEHPEFSDIGGNADEDRYGGDDRRAWLTPPLLPRKHKEL